MCIRMVFEWYHTSCPVSADFAQFQIIKSSHSQSAGRAASQEKQSISGKSE